MSEANVSIKQRLVGAVVLVSLGVIFLPMLLDGEGPFQSVKREKFIPKEPEVKKVFEVARAEKAFIPEAPIPSQASQSPTAINKPQVSQAQPSANIVDRISEEALGDAKKQDMAKAVDSNQDVMPVSKNKPALAVLESPGKKDVSKSRKVIEALKKNNTKTAKAWAVQLGSFKTKPNALRLRDKLRKKGFPSYVEAVKTKQGENYRVRVGPELLLTNAESLKIKLSKVARIDGIIVSH